MAAIKIVTSAMQDQSIDCRKYIYMSVKWEENANLWCKHVLLNAQSENESAFLCEEPKVAFVLLIKV